MLCTAPGGLPLVSRSANTALPQYWAGAYGVWLQGEEGSGVAPIGVSNDRYLVSLGVVPGS